MTQQERAKQFMAFDAMKGLQEALRDREERHSRVDRRILSEESVEEISDTLSQLETGMIDDILYYRAFHESQQEGEVGRIDPIYKFLTVGKEKIYFKDIYRLAIVG